MVDAQAHVAAEGGHAVIPPAEGFLGLLEQAEGVGEPEREDGAKRLALRVAHEHLPSPGVGIVHVAVLGGDVVVAEHGHLAPRRELALQPARERGEPAQLVVVLVGADALPVGAVDAHDAYPADVGGDDALLQVGEAGNARA